MNLKQSARNWIRKNLKGDTRSKLLNGIGIYVRRKGINLRDYTIRDLIIDVGDGTIHQLPGICSRMVQELKDTIIDKRFS